MQELLDQTPPGETVSTLVHLSEQVDLRGITQVLDSEKATLHMRHEVVVTELQAVAGATQGPLVAHLQDLLEQGRIAQYHAFWIRNVIRVDTTPAEIALIAARDDVGTVFFNPGIETITPVGEEKPVEQGAVAGGPEPGVVAVRAPEVWEILGIDGSGRLVSSLDTGIDGNHPALASRWRGLDPAYAGNPQWAWFDPVDGTTFPTPCNGSHGTHTMGSVCGGLPGNQIGVAPGADWIHARVIDCVSIPQTVSDAMLAFEWTADPDGNPGTSFDVPDTSSNSWGLADFHGYPDCDEAFWSFLDACEAAGVVIIFSAGNEGSGGLRRPSDRATDDYRTFAVAAVDGNNPGFPIAGFSSRGPTNCTPDGSSAIKPDISAPGVNVISSVPGGGYSSLSGTSMASPHINGVVALMRQANPNISVEQVKQVIYDTAQDLGNPGEDNDYGWGMVDAFDAVQAAIGLSTLTIQLPNGTPDVVGPTAGTAVEMDVIEQNATADPGTASFHWRTDGGAYNTIAMSQIDPDTYEAVFPDLPCFSTVEFYFSIDTTDGDTVSSPFSAPDAVYSADVYTGIDISFEDDFESDLGWTVSDGAGLTTGSWERGTPVGGGDRGDPADDADGSGQCYVTQNIDGDFDIDGGSTTLTSPNMDATALDNPVIRYHSWYNNASGAAPEQDIMTVEVSDDGGSSWTLLEQIGPSGPEVNGGWFLKEHLISDFVNVTSTFRIRFTAADTDPPSIVEAGVDGVEIRELVCDSGEPCTADINGSGDVGVDDLVAVILAWGSCGDCPEDVDGDGEVGVLDLTEVILSWGECP